MNSNAEIQRLLRNIEAEVSNSRNYKSFDSSMGYDQDFVDDGMLNFDSSMQFDPEDSVLGFKGKRKELGLSTYAINILYVDNFASGTPVSVELFGTDFNTGTIVGQTLVFTNPAGEQAIVSGRRVSFVALQNRLRYSPFRIRYARIKPQDADQFDNPWVYRTDSVWGGLQENDQTPEEYLTPEQFQLLRVDMPMGYSVDSEHRIIFDVNATEIGNGMNVTFWIDKVEDPISKLKGKPALKQMGGSGMQNSMPSLSTAKALDSLIKAQKRQVETVNKLAASVPLMARRID